MTESIKTHELAKALTILARVLRAGPNVELSNLDLAAQGTKPLLPRDNAPAALALLASFAEYSKPEWIALIRELSLDVPVKPTDSTRDLLGRLLKYISDNEHIRNQLADRARSASANVSPELVRALTILMKR